MTPVLVMIAQQSPILLMLYVVSNLIIVTGYMVLGAFVVPSTRFSRTSTKVGGLVFFVTCGLHHLHNVSHTLSNRVYASVSLGWQHVVVDVVQAVAVVAFTYGLIREVHYKELPIKGREGVV